MFCTSCGKEIPDGSMVCSECNKPIVTAQPEVAPVSEDSSTPVAEAPVKRTSDLDLNFGSLFGDFFKDPVGAVETRTRPTSYVIGIIVIAALAFVSLLNWILLTGDFGQAFGMTFSLVCAVAALVFSFFLLQGKFITTKFCIFGTLSMIGTSLISFVILYFFGGIADAVFETNIFSQASYALGLIFSALIVSRVLEEKTDSRVKSFWMTLIMFGSFTSIYALFSFIVTRI
ncbi:MAG: zinc-ribbon domain-containing protein [Clostridiaceae bacterium]|nr:zinc-ribbon domain-containing protein [Clostridiaceae bacterium]